MKFGINTFHPAPTRREPLGVHAMLRAAPELILIAEDASTRKKTVGNLSECIKQAAG